jgi:hypothetical protein
LVVVEVVAAMLDDDGESSVFAALVLDPQFANRKLAATSDTQTRGVKSPTRTHA